MKLNRLLKIILVIFLFCIYTYTNAQNLEVLTFVLDNAETDAYFEEVKDVNGYKCALIKVLLHNIPVNKIKFELKGGAEIVRATPKPPGELWVYLSPQTEHCRIITEGYGNINYYEFPTGPLKSTKTYIMDLRTDIKLKLVEEKIEPEFLKIKTEPTNDVEVFIDNINQGLTPIKPLKILPGNHSVKLAKNLYHNLDTNVLVKINTNNNFIFKLKPKFGKLVINSKGEFNDAKIYLDEEEKCRTPCTIEVVKSANHRIIIKKDLYADYDEQFTMYDGQIYTIPNLTLKPIYATISLRTNPQNAEIYINKEKVSINGILTNYKVRSGTYFIEAKLKNYKDFQKSVVLKEQENFIETIQLEPQLGDISIESDPIDCEIYLNGVKQNRLTPTVLRNLQVGSYQLELKKDGFTSIKKQIEIKDGETNKLPIYNLEKDINLIFPDLAKTEMVFVQGGTFTMGCTDEQGTDCKDNEKPTHQVTLSDYYIGKYEVTQGLWKKVMGSNPSDFKNCGDDCPVERVSWDDCQEFISKLNQLTGKHYRLPTDAEWEYAARGGRGVAGNVQLQTKYAGSNALGEVAWYDQNSDVNYSGRLNYNGRKLGTHTVGTKKPNALGIFDMSGNVWEWCNDRYRDYSSDEVMNLYEGSYRVVRGGGWNEYGSNLRVSNRNSFDPSNSSYCFGLRLVSP